MTQSIALPMTESSQIGDARRMATALAGRMGFDDTDTGSLAIVVTEIATNLVRHAVGGELLLRPLENQEPSIEILALDRGPGIPNLDQSFRDGYSTGGTSGTGLGAVKRLSSFMDVYTQPSTGTVLVSHFHSSDSHKLALHKKVEIGAVSVAVTGEKECGDSWAVRSSSNAWELIVADGLGHGSQAAEASQCMTEIFTQHPDRGITKLLETGHRALRSSRGAAVAIAAVEFSLNQLRFAGVGNIGASIISGRESRSLMSHNGTVGLAIRKIQEFVYPWNAEDLLILFSDGLNTHWRLDAYPGLISRHPSIIAGVLYRDFTRQRDDVTVVVFRQV